MLIGPLGQQIAGQIFDRKRVERRIAVKRRDHVIPVEADFTYVVAVVANRVGVTHQVEPVECQPFTKMLRIKQAIDHALVLFY